MEERKKGYNGDTVKICDGTAKGHAKTYRGPSAENGASYSLVSRFPNVIEKKVSLNNIPSTEAIVPIQPSPGAVESGSVTHCEQI